jgi:hypothetical protein
VTLQLGFVGVSFAADGTNVRLKIEEKYVEIKQLVLSKDIQIICSAMTTNKMNIL